MQDYRIQLDTYSGPMDLLLYLIRREEVDVYDIPIARILEQYLAYIRLLKVLDPEVIGDFLVMAATLMEIKSRMLLPKPPPDEDDDDGLDPRADLVRQLLAYKAFRDAASNLGQRAELHARRFARPPGALPPDGEEESVDLEEAQVWDLLTAFNKLLASVGRQRTVHEVVYDDTPITLHALDIQDRLGREGPAMAFERIFDGRTLGEMIGLFLALLELIRQKRVRVDQPNPFGTIMVHLIDPSPITTAAEDEVPEAPDVAGDMEDGLEDEEVEAEWEEEARDGAARAEAVFIDDGEDDEDEDDAYRQAIDAITIGDVDLGRSHEEARNELRHGEGMQEP